jgi:hypothetical protein
MEPSSTSHQTISTRLHTRLESNAPQALTSTPTQTRLQHESPAPTDAYSPRFTNASPEDSADQLALDLGQLRELRLQTPQTSSVAPLITKGPSNAALQTIETSQNRNLQPPLYASAAQPLHPPVARASQPRRALHQASASLQHPAAVHNPHSTFPEPRHVADAQAPRPHTRASALAQLFVNLLLRPRELLITFLMCPLSRLPRLFECRLLCLACLLRQENFQARATLIESQTPRWQQVHTIYHDLNRRLTQQTGQITPDSHPRSQPPGSSLYEPRPGSRD